MELGKFAMEQGDYQEAYQNFRKAQAVAPNEREPTFFINVIKSLQEDRVEIKPATKVFHPYKRSRAQIIEDELKEQEKRLPARPASPLAAHVELEPVRVVPKPDLTEEDIRRAGPVPAAPRPALRTPTGETLPPSEPKTTGAPSKPAVVRTAENIVYLNDDLWSSQPGTVLRVELDGTLMLEGSNIKRYLIITPDFIDVMPAGKDRVNIVAKKRGMTFLHVWDDRGRWTFHVEVILPVRGRVALQADESQIETRARPFRLSYSSDWSSYYRGPTFKDAERENLGFLQQAFIEGEVPYGDLDSYVIFNKFEASTEVTGYGLSLTDGKIGDFKDFSIRAFDLQKMFSPLTMPGQYVRGVLFEAMAFNKNLQYSYIHGRDRAVYGFLSPDVLVERESYVEGARVTLFPEKDNQYSVNYARGYGDAREPFLKDQVISLEAQRRVKDILLHGEFAYDEEATAITAESVYSSDYHSLTLSFRDIEDDFTTVTSFPGRRGEVGGSAYWNWRPNDVNINTYLDLYHEGAQPNPEALGTLNVDFSTRADLPLSKTSRLMASLYYLDTSGELTPRNNIQSNLTYTKTLPGFWGRDITAFAGATQQRSRFDFSPSSEYDRYSLSTGVAVPLTGALNYNANYEYSWVYEELSGDILTPGVFSTGLSYSQRVFDAWHLNSGVTYRDEENTEGTNSFLAGEDSVTGSLGAAFRPSDDFELFIDGRARTIWGQEVGRESYNDYDVRAGVRTSWETPFRWDPKGTVKGVVYKDLNGDQRQGPGEQGMAGVKVKIGNKTAVTDEAGRYQGSVRAKSAEVALDIDSIPDGFIFSTPMVEKVLIVPYKVHRVDFGLTTQSGIYGVVFCDKNGNGKPDTGDEFFADTKITLDGTETAVSDFEGAYFFENIQPGAHTIAIDVNSLPITYLPKIKIKNTVTTAEGAMYIFHIPLDKNQAQKS